MKIKEIIRDFEAQIPLALQDSWDNSGLMVGDPEQELTGILIAVDVTEEILEEAVSKGANMVMTHHPLLFHALKQITPRTYIERCVVYALKHDLVIYAAHTNLDNSPIGVNQYWAKQMGLLNARAISPLSDYHYKLNTYVPQTHANQFREAMMSAGIGTQGAYSGCSFSTKGDGRFRADEGAHPFVGVANEWHNEAEESISILLRKDQIATAKHIIEKVHPYEEPAFDLYPIRYDDPKIGAGVVGDLPEALTIEELIDKMATFQPIHHVSYSTLRTDKVKRIAYCGGSGAFLLKEAARAGADIFITGEAKYNDYYDAQDLIPLLTFGHYESEELTKKLLNNILCKKNSTFALWYSDRCKNPLNYISR